MIGDIHVNTHKNQENIFMFSDCTARSEPIKYHHMTCCFGFVNKKVWKSSIYYDLHALMIMMYLAVLLYPFVYKAKTARHRNNLWKGQVCFEILIWKGASLLEILIWVHYKGMWIKNLPYMSY
jgi:hypothetical protein